MPLKSRPAAISRHDRSEESLLAVSSSEESLLTKKDTKQRTSTKKDTKQRTSTKKDTKQRTSTKKGTKQRSPTKKSKKSKKGKAPKVLQEDEDAYEGLEIAEHVRLRPALYVGSIDRDDREEWHLIKKKEVVKAVHKKTTIPFAVSHLLREMCSNVADNVFRSRRKGIDPGECTIDVEDNKVTITNGGLCIPIKKRMKKVKKMVADDQGNLVPLMIVNDKGKRVPVKEKIRSTIYIPEECFAVMLSGSNLGEERNEGGAHGIGAKAANILGSSFGVHILNPVQHESYYQTWQDGPDGRTEPVIEKYRGKESVIKVWYVIDHKIFGYKEEEFKYSKSAVQIFHWIAAALSFTASIPVTFNGERMEYDAESYAKLYEINGCRSVVIEEDNLKMILLDTPFLGTTASFANCINTPNGGGHIKSALNAIKEVVMSTINKRGKDDDTDKKKKKPVAKKKKDECRITIATVRQHITVILSVTGIKEPKWDDGQIKTTMKSHVPIVLPKEVDEIKKWGVVEQIQAFLRSKYFKEFGKAEAGMKKGRHMVCKYGEDAELAGTKDFMKARMIAVEGGSAEGCVAEMLDFLDGGKKNWGVFTMGGKPLNVLKATEEKIFKNKELSELVRRLGLKPDVDYTQPENFKKLRYGGITMMTDADIDGVHIKMLILCILDFLYPSVLKIPGYVTDFWTPYKIAMQGKKKTRKFYYEKQFNDWQKTSEATTGKWTYKYFKGLGSCRTQDIKGNVKHKKEIRLIYDAEAHAKIILAMGKSTSANRDLMEERQFWMRRFRPDNVDDVRKKLKISTFADQFYRNYMYHTISRNMPQIDGLSNVGRKIIFGAFHVWGRKCTSTKEPKVPEFAGEVSKKTVYHHGESILHSVINTAQDFCGSNNLPLIIGVGRFGSMEKGGKHAAAPRYLNVKASPLLPLIFHPDDDSLLSMHEEEGDEVEPKCYLPIFSLALVNGVDAVCVGWRSKIPNHHPMEVVDALLNRLKGVPFPDLHPWYRGYKGETFNVNGKFISRGVYTVDDLEEGDYTIECLPVGVWNHKYKKALVDHVMDGTIKDYSNRSSATKTYFQVKGHKLQEGELLTEKAMGVVKDEVLSNMSLVGASGFPVTYSTIPDLQEDFYRLRLPYFQLRKDAILKKLNTELEVLQDKALYIQAYLDKKLKLRGEPEAVIERIEALDLQLGFYMKMPGYKEIKQRELNIKVLTATKQLSSEVKKRIKKVTKKTPEGLWTEDLVVFKQKYVEMYPDDERIYII